MSKIKHPEMVKILQLPDVEYFQSSDKQIFPLMKFYDWVVRTGNPMLDVLSLENVLTDYIRNIQVSRIVITPNYDAKLRKVTKQFLMRKYKTYAKMAEKEIMWHFMDVGPSTIEIEGLKDDQVCLLTDYLLKRSDNE